MENVYGRSFLGIYIHPGIPSKDHHSLVFVPVKTIVLLWLFDLTSSRGSLRKFTVMDLQGETLGGCICHSYGPCVEMCHPPVM